MVFQLKRKKFNANDDVLLERETTRLQDFLSTQKFMGCSRFNQHSLGWWSGLRRAKHFSKFRRSADLATASGAANGSLGFCFTAKIDSFKTKRQCAVCLCWRGLAGAILHSVLMGQLWFSGLVCAAVPIRSHYAT